MATKCCERDTNGDGNCDRHSAPGVLRQPGQERGRLLKRPDNAEPGTAVGGFMPSPVFDAWQSYERNVVPPEASATQREECRRAFYAGALSGYGLTLAACTDDDENTCERNLTNLSAEINSILSDLKQ